MGRTLDVTDQGEVRFFEARAGGSNRVALKAPAALAGDFSLTLPTALPGSTLFLQVNTSGEMSFSAGGGTLQAAYDAGQTIAVNGVTPITFNQANNTALLDINKTGTGAGAVVDIDNDGTGTALSVKQDADGRALDILQTVDSSQAVCRMRKTAAGTGILLEMDNDGNSTCLNITQDGAGRAINLAQNGNQEACLFTQNANQNLFTMSKGSFGAGDGIALTNNGTGAGIRITQQSQDGIALVVTSSRNVATCTITKTGAAAGTCLQVENDGTGVGIDLIQDGAGIALRVDQDGNAEAVTVDQSQNQIGVRITKSGAASAVAALKIQHDAGPNENDPDIEGTTARWFISRGGIFKCQRLEMTVAGATISGGGITVSRAGMYEVDTEAAAATDDLDNINQTGGDPCTAGCVLILRPISGARTVVVRHNGGGTGNIRLNGSADYSMDNDADTLVLVYSGALWLEIGRGNNGT